jgi:hypothetical protein
MKKSLVCFALLASLLTFHTGALAAGVEMGREDMIESDAALILVDLVAVRPLSYIALAAGAILSLPALLLQDMAGNDTEPIKKFLVFDPYNFAVTRPLGDFSRQE